MKRVVLVLAVVLGFAMMSCSKKDCEVAQTSTEQKLGAYHNAEMVYIMSPSSLNKDNLQQAASQYQKAVKNENKACK